MPNILISAQTAAYTSMKFVVATGLVQRGISAWGLAGVETITIYRDRGDGTMVALTDTASILTATLTGTSIIATGTYQLVKTVTAGAAGASID